MTDDFVSAYSKSTGREHWVPRRFFDQPELCRDLTLDAPAGGPAVDVTPGPADSAKAVEDVPSEKWKNADIEQWATDHGVNLDGATTKADMLAAVNAAAPPPVDQPALTAIGVSHPAPEGPTPSTTETPATGDAKE